MANMHVIEILPIMHIQHHSCWWPGDAWCHVIDLPILENSGFSTRMVKAKWTYIHTLYLFPQSNQAGSSNPLRKARTYLSYIVSIMAVDDMVTKGVRASTTMMTKFAQNNQGPGTCPINAWIHPERSLWYFSCRYFANTCVYFHFRQGREGKEK